MRIVIDLQGAQGASRDRGIGRYTMSLAKAIVSNRGNHEVIIALNGLFTESIEPIRAAFAGLLSSENIKVWQAVGPVHPLDSKNIWRRQTAELLREEFLASLQPDVLHITSIFEGFVDDAIHSIGKLPGNIFTAVTVYDLIPLIQSSEYLDTNENYKQFYREKLKHLTHANLFLSISESSRREVIEHLAIEPKYVVNISAAADSHFQPIKVSEHSKKALFKRFGITSPFLMYSGATDERKNHLRLIKAFSILKPELKKSLQLVLVGGLPDSDRQRFVDHTKKCGIEVGKIIITGKVTDEEMVCLYNLCALFVFPSWHEGFGLPALEAMSCGAPAIGSNNTSVPEVLGLDEALFDPFSEESIAKKIETVLSDEVLRLRLASHGLAKSKEFSWDETAKRAIFAFESAQKQKHSNALLKLQPADKKQKLAMFSPAPPEKSGISTYTAELLPALSEFYDIDLIVTQKLVSDDWIVKNINIQTPEWFLENQHLFDRIVYQFGNSPFHQHMFDLLLTAPGVVVLHDFYLSSIVAHIDVQGINPNFWSRQLYYAYGYQSVIERTFSND